MNADGFELNHYEVTGNHFQGALNMWRSFAQKNHPENRDFANHIKADENRAIDVVIKEIKAYGSLKISFDKDINFQREGPRGPTGEITTERMTHFFKGGQFIVTKATTRAEVVENYRKTMDDINSQTEAWDTAGSGWDVASVESGYVNTSRYASTAGSSYI